MAIRSLRSILEAERSGKWVSTTINLRASQYEALAQLADQFGISTSRAARRIIASYLADLDEEAAREEDSRRIRY